MISQEQSAELGYSSGYAGEKMVPLSDVMLPPHGTGGGRKGEGQRDIYISEGREYERTDPLFSSNR